DSELSARERLSREFFLDVERQRYALQPHILECLSWIDWPGKRVLEVGAGVGTDARRIVGAGAIYTGINVDRGSAEATERALRVLGLRLLCLPGMIPLLERLGLPRAKLERHRQIYLERGFPSEGEWLSRNTNGPDYPYCRVYDADGARDLLAGFEIVRHEIRF